MEKLAFYEVAAQVIPVLFIALLIERQVVGKGYEESPAAALGLLAIIVFAAIGEFVAISALAEDRHPTQLEKAVVGGAIVMLFLPMIIGAARPRAEAIGKTLPWTRSLGQLVVLSFIALLVAATFTGIKILPILAGGAIVFFLIASGFTAFESDLRRMRDRKREKEDGR